MNGRLAGLQSLSAHGGVYLRSARAKVRSRDAIILTTLLVAAATIVVATFIAFWFTEQEPNLDDLGLFNPVHTYLQTGHMSYPIYGMFDATIVHPPTHYLILAWVMRTTGLPVEAAALVPLLVWLPLIAALVVCSRFSVAAKFAFLAGAFAGLVIWAPPSFIRPDLHQATVWLAGLVALETGRLANWDWRRLGLGATLIALSSVLHYPALPSLAAVAVYAMWASLSLGFRTARPALAALGVGTALVLTPYAAFYLVPHWSEITEFARQANERGGTGWLAGFDQARQQYHYFSDTEAAGRTLGLVAAPVLKFGIPVVFVTTPLLAFRRETRGIALASAPYLLFLLFYARGKSVYYYTPEFTLYFVCVAYATLLVLCAVLKRIGADQRLRVRAIAVAGLAIVAAVVVLEPATLRGGGYRSWRPLHQDMEIARTAGSELLPSNSLVGTNDIGLWYVSGATRTHYFTLDLDVLKDMSQVNLRGYLREFDAVAEARYDSWATFNRQREAIPKWYANGLLNVRGFYFGDRRGKPLTWMGYLLFSVQKLPITGFAFRGRELSYFRPTSRGGHVFSIAICPATSVPATQYLTPWEILTTLPGTTYPPTPSKRTITAFLDETRHYRSVLRPILARSCDIRQEVQLAAKKQDVRDFLHRWRTRPGHDKVEILPHVSAEKALYTPPSETVPSRPNVGLAQVAAAPELVVRKARGLLGLVTPEEQYAQVFALPLPPESRRLRWLKLHLRVAKGRLGICILDLESGQGCLLRRSLYASRSSGTTYLPIPPTRNRIAFYMDNDQRGRSEVELRSIELVRVARVRGSPSSARHPGN